MSDLGRPAIGSQWYTVPEESCVGTDFQILTLLLSAEPLWRRLAYLQVISYLESPLVFMICTKQANKVLLHFFIAFFRRIFSMTAIYFGKGLSGTETYVSHLGGLTP